MKFIKRDGFRIKIMEIFTHAMQQNALEIV